MFCGVGGPGLEGPSWGLRYQAKHGLGLSVQGLPLGILMGWEAVPLLLTCYGTLSKFLPFSGLTFPERKFESVLFRPTDPEAQNKDLLQRVPLFI